MGNEPEEDKPTGNEPEEDKPTGNEPEEGKPEKDSPAEEDSLQEDDLRSRTSGRTSRTAPP